MLRLQGCSVGCPWCDTPESWHALAENRVDTIEEALEVTTKYAEVTQSVIVRYIKSRYSAYKWVLLSGGEPAEQYLAPLVHDLHLAGFKVALETSGTATGHLESELDWITVSPKFGMPGNKEVRNDCLKGADEIKMVVGKRSDISRLDAAINDNDLQGKIICLQPVSQSPGATRLCIKTVQERGWRLSVQIHKYLEIP